eukprot:1541094-Amphidinium_carterae.1
MPKCEMAQEACSIHTQHPQLKLGMFLFFVLNDRSHSRKRLTNARSKVFCCNKTVLEKTYQIKWKRISQEVKKKKKKRKIKNMKSI